MKKKNKIEKNFISKIDRELNKFDSTRPKTASQLVEIKKHKRVFYLRDNPVIPSSREDIWNF